MRRALVALAVLLVSASADASMVLFACTPVRCVAVSDSRAMLQRVAPDGTRTNVSHRDDWSKLAFEGRFILAGTNDTEAEPYPAGGLGLWRAWQALPPQQSETAAQYLARLVAALPAHMVPSRWELSAGVGVFKFGPLPDAVVAGVKCQPGGQPYIDDRADAGVFPVIAILGADDLDFAPIKARLRPKLAANPSEQDIVAAVRQEITAAMRQTNTVGGELHTVVVDAAGGRWVK